MGDNMAIIKASVLQAGTVALDTDATLAKAEAMIAEAGGIGARIAVLPEGFVGGYPKGADFHIYLGARTPEGRDEFRRYFETAILVPGPETERLGRAARHANLFLTAGVIEREGGTLYCTALFFGPDGTLLGKHRKLMPTALERLCWGFGDGSTLTAVPTPWGKLGAVICWENYMPMLRMAMYAKELAFYCAPTADDRDTWASSMTHVALEGRCFVLSACQYLTRAHFPNSLHNRLGDEPDRVLMRGGSLIVSPLGRMLAGPLWNEEGVLTAELDSDDIARGRIDFDAAGHYARPDIFKLEVDERPMPAVSKRLAQSQQE
jgi:nitrilase